MTHIVETKTPDSSATTVLGRYIVVDGLNIFFREAGHSSSPKLVLLHGFPASSHQYRNLIVALPPGAASY